jgi:hypothetical protein
MPEIIGKLSRRQKFLHWLMVKLAGDWTFERPTNLVPESRRIKGIRLWLYKKVAHLNYLEGVRLVKKYKTHSFE